jgi:hypothetical protein
MKESKKEENSGRELLLLDKLELEKIKTRQAKQKLMAIQNAQDLIQLSNRKACITQFDHLDDFIREKKAKGYLETQEIDQNRPLKYQ